MRQRIDGADSSYIIANADCEGAIGKTRQRAIEEAAAITKAITGAIETDDRRDHNVWKHFGTVRWDRNIPNPRHEFASGFPKAKDERSLLLDYDG